MILHYKYHEILTSIKLITSLVKISTINKEFYLAIRVLKVKFEIKVRLCFIC